MNKDPLVIYRSRLESLGFAAADLDRIEEAARAEIDAATAAAEAAAEPGEAVLMTDLWAHGGSSWRH
jgi:TPP-dependent pyruvate/acetoin dehydrogenase alpha subunit